MNEIKNETTKEETSLSEPTAASFFGWLSSPKAQKIIVWAGLIGMLLILLSSLFGDRHQSVQETAADVTSGGDYADVMEQKLHELLLCVDGVADCRVMVTLESGSRVVYASGGKEPLTECEPTVRGVVVVLNGDDSETTVSEVKNVVKTALHLAEKRVCVVSNANIEN